MTPLRLLHTSHPRSSINRNLYAQITRQVNVTHCLTHVFFIVTAADGVGRWSSEDCKRISTSGGRTKCDCSQLGHFGLFFVSLIAQCSGCGSIRQCFVGPQSWEASITTCTGCHFICGSNCVSPVSSSPSTDLPQLKVSHTNTYFPSYEY